MASILDHFDALIEYGLKIIPLYENTKIPIYKNWNKNWDRDWARENLTNHPNCNLGVLLGDIVDVEGDSEEANRLILSMIKDYPHPTYKSSKSIHHLFLTPDASLRHLRWKDIEFRGRDHQSVLPPSRTKGITYKWLRNFKFPVPVMPEELFGFFQSKKKYIKSKKDLLKPGHMKITCIICQKKKFIHKKRFELELKAFKFLGKKWQCHDCRDTGLQSLCRKMYASK